MTLLAISIRCKLLEYRISNWTRFCHGSWETNVLCLALYYRFVRKANSKIASKVIYLPRIYIFRVSFYLFIVIPFSVLYYYFCSNRYSISCSKLYKIPCRVIITKNRLILTEGIIFTRSSFLSVNLLEASKNLISPFVTWAMWQIRWELLKNQFHPTSLPTRRNTLLIQCWQLQHCPLTPRAWRKKIRQKEEEKETTEKRRRWASKEETSTTRRLTASQRHLKARARQHLQFSRVGKVVSQPVAHILTALHPGLLRLLGQGKTLRKET